MDYERESGMLKALGHPVRLKIVEKLMVSKECNVNRMVNQLGIPQSTVSQHLGILKSRGVIISRKEGVKTCYKVAHKRIGKIIETLR